MDVKRYFADISPRTWEHPADKSTLAILKALPGLDQLVKALVSVTTERSLRMIALSSSVRASEKQYAKIHLLLEEACQILDVKIVPEIYVAQSPFLNAGAMGVEKPFITLNSSTVAILTEKELLSVIGHELGHVLSGHLLYKTLLWLLLNISTIAFQLPVAGIALYAIISALKEWDRKSELSADRAGLLVVQEVDPCYTTLMKTAGGNQPEEMHLEEFFKQAEEYEQGGDILDSVHKILNLLGQTHPFPVLRLKELKTWVDSGASERVLAGDYIRRGDEKPPDVLKGIGDAAEAYKEDFETSKDPLIVELRKLGKNLEDAGKMAGQQAEDFLKRIFNPDN